MTRLHGLLVAQPRGGAGDQALRQAGALDDLADRGAGMGSHVLDETKAGALVQEQDPNDRRRTLVGMNEKRRAEDFAERGARGIGDAIRLAVPGANDSQIAEIESGLDHLVQQLFHSAGT